MNRNITCILCPRGCTVEVTDAGGTLSAKGFSCPKGEAYARSECIAPKRTVTSAVRVENRSRTMVSVKTDAPVPKEKVGAVMEKIRALSVKAPVRIGDVLLKEVYGASVIATKTVL